MGKAKIKIGEDQYYMDDLSNYVTGRSWDYYKLDYDFGKNFNFDEMETQRALLLQGLRDGSIVYNPDYGGTKYQFQLVKPVEGLDISGGDAAKYAAGFIGKAIRDGKILKIIEEPWNTATYHSDLLKNKFYNGLDVDLATILSTANLDDKKKIYNDIINFYSLNTTDIPEELLADLTNFYTRAAGFMNDGTIGATELLDLLRYLGNLGWNNFNTIIEKSDKVKTPTVDSIRKPEVKKEDEFETLFTLDTSNKITKKDIEKIINLNETEYNKLLNAALSNPNKSTYWTNIILLHELLKSKKKSGQIILKSNNEDFIFDISSKTLKKKKKQSTSTQEDKKEDKEEEDKNALAVHQNVETPTNQQT